MNWEKIKNHSKTFWPIVIHTPATKLNTLIIQTSFFWSWGGRRVTPKYSLPNKISKIQRIANQWHPTKQIGQTKYSQTVWHIHDGPQVVDQCSFCGTCIIGSKAFWSRISISKKWPSLLCQLAKIGPNLNSKLWSFSIIHQLKSKQSRRMYYWSYVILKEQRIVQLCS